MLHETLLYWISHYGYIGIFVLLMLGIVGLPVPDETLLGLSGYLVFKGELHFVPTFVAAFSGSICGITVSYLIGRKGGAYLLKKYGAKIHFTPEKVQRVHDWLSHSGHWGLTFGYFIPGVRHLTALVAGSSRLEYPTFALFAYLGGFLWASVFVSAGYYFGEEWSRASAKLHDVLLIICAIAIALAIAYYFLKKRRTH